MIAVTVVKCVCLREIPVAAVVCRMLYAAAIDCMQQCISAAGVVHAVCATKQFAFDELVALCCFLISQGGGA